MKKIIFDIGANDGKEVFERAQDPNTITYAFEPTRELLTHYLWPSADRYPNVIIVPFAIDTTNTFKLFNVAGQGDWGCSSLYEFTDDILTKWPGRSDFSKTHSYTVPTVTLFDFCELYGITSIDYLEIDAQGSDFNVLKSLKDKIKIVKSGMIEGSNNVDLYKGVDNRVEHIREYLMDNGFNIVGEFANDYLSAEVNIHFEKQS